MYRPAGQELNPKYTRKTVKHGGGNVMVWGCMAANGVGNLVLIESKMDHQMYILKDNLLPRTKKLGITNNYVFQQDHDPKHIACNSRLYLLCNL